MLPFSKDKPLLGGEEPFYKDKPIFKGEEVHYDKS